ncbi:MAG: S41 family peptidase [Thermoanaerobaculia bacterium]
MIRQTLVLSGVILTVAIAALAQTAAQSAAPRLDDAVKRQVIRELGTMLRDRYVFPDVGGKAARHIESRLAAGEYKSAAVASTFADTLTRDLQEITKDKHLNVSLQPPAIQATRDDAEKRRLQFERQVRRDNCGFKKVELLPGNVGYLHLNVFGSPELCGETAVSAMGFLANADAIIIDLRQNGGGEPSMVQLLSTYFFDQPTHLNSLYWREGDRTEQYWTLPHVSGRRMPKTPLWVLTSERTFSGAEEFSYNVRMLGRARLVGEASGGGANPGDFMDLPGGLGVFMPTGRAINPISRTNWEGTGVEPHVKVAAAEALGVAHLEALRALQANAGGSERAELEWEIAGIEFKPGNVRLDDAARSRYVGAYGERRVSLRDGELYYQREGRPVLRLVPMTETLFAVEGLDYFRVRFERGSDGATTKLVGIYADGTSDESPRDAK